MGVNVAQLKGLPAGTAGGIAFPNSAGAAGSSDEGVDDSDNSSGARKEEIAALQVHHVAVRTTMAHWSVYCRLHN